MAFVNKIGNTQNIIFKSKTNQSGDNFEDLLKKEIDSTNNALEKANKLEVGIATGEVQNLAVANITIEKAELQMKMMLEVRNKAINAYKELLKTQI